jgi:hypothetical protein
MTVRYTRLLRAWRGLDDIGAAAKSRCPPTPEFSPTTSTIYGNASIVARPLSSTRPPRFETMMPSMNETMSSALVVGGRWTAPMTAELGGSGQSAEGRGL